MYTSTGTTTASFADLLDSAFAVPPCFNDQLRFEYVKDDACGVVHRTCHAVSPLPPTPTSTPTPSCTGSDGSSTLAETVRCPSPTPDEQSSIEFIADAIDVFCVGPCSAARWRTYIDVAHWDPLSHHDELLMTRAYHAKVLYELSLLFEMCNKEWVCRQTIEHLRLAAMLNLRSTEVHLATFQLTTGQIGFKKGRDRLYKAAVLVHSVHMHMFDMFCSSQALAGTAKLETNDFPRPTMHWSCAKLVQSVDANLTAIHMFMKCGRHVFVDPGALDAPEQGRKLAQMLTLLVRTLDDVVHVIVK